MPNGGIVEQQEPIKDSWWLFTTNYLIPFKGYFSTRKEARQKCYELMKQSLPYFKKKLRKEAAQEATENEWFKEDPTKKIKTTAARALEMFKGFKESDLSSSITLIECSECDENLKQEIFCNGFRK